ncbi:MAG: penicillin-binding transpeptidase domain-containing protein [Defluviitaleaceae bacterium]|nr:penicillin-binding transpeptidase domain-containing protein [Defluviitaleaceae bacterium]
MSKNLRTFLDNVKYLLAGVYRWFKSPVFRVHILKMIAASLALLLFVTAYMVHIIYADEYVAFQNITTTANLRSDVSRGVIFDRNGAPLVTNDAISVITYRHVPNTYTGEMRRIARELSKLIEFTEEEVNSILSFRDKQDLFIFLNLEYVRDLVSDADRRYAGNDNALFNAMMVAQVTQDHVDLLTEDELRAHAIFMRMHQGAGRTTNIIKENPTDDEMARVMENLGKLPGIDIGVDWDREYPSALSRDFFGHVSTHQQGIPRDREAYFLSQGYAANARVGMSQLERSLHAQLSGFQARYFIENGVPTQLSEGLPGFNVSLNLDTELQFRVEEIVTDMILNERQTQSVARYLYEAYVVMADPRTGAVLSMVGVVLSPNEEGVLEATMNPLGTIHRASAVGSSIKGATLMAGYDVGVTTVGQIRHDSSLHFQGSRALGSWTPMGNVNEVIALSRSSNVYFFRQSMELAGVYYTPNGQVLGWENDNEAWDVYRNFFGQLGLGSATGIELTEGTGFTATRNFINLLFFSIGQADTYTPMQLAQFASVLATRGDRMQMQLVQNIYMPGSMQGSQQLIRAFEPNLLNRIELTDEQWDTISEGHRRVIQESEGTAFGIFRGVDFRPAGKTGTAEDFLRDGNGHIFLDEARQYTEVYNRSFVAYAPYDNPQIAISVIVPQAQIAGTRGPQNIAAVIAREAMRAYFDLQVERANGR